MGMFNEHCSFCIHKDYTLTKKMIKAFEKRTIGQTILINSIQNFNKKQKVGKRLNS